MRKNMVTLTTKTTATTVDKAEIAAEKAHQKVLLAAEKAKTRKTFDDEIKALDVDFKTAQATLTLNYQKSQKALKDVLKLAQDDFYKNDALEDAVFREANAKLKEQNKNAKDYAKEKFDEQIEEITTRSV